MQMLCTHSQYKQFIPTLKKTFKKVTIDDINFGNPDFILMKLKYSKYTVQSIMGV